MAKPMDIVNEYIILMITIIVSTLNVNICTRNLANYLKVNLIKILLQLLCCSWGEHFTNSGAPHDFTE